MQRTYEQGFRLLNDGEGLRIEPFPPPRSWKRWVTSSVVHAGFLVDRCVRVTSGSGRRGG